MGWTFVTTKREAFITILRETIRIVDSVMRKSSLGNGYYEGIGIQFIGDLTKLLHCGKIA